MRKVLIATALVLLPWQVHAQIGNSAGWSPDTRTEKAGLPSPDQSNYQDHLFAQLAAGGGLAGVDLGKLAAGKAVDPGVKRFAQRMADDHDKSNGKLKSIAQKSNIPLPTNIDAEHGKARADLNKLNGQQFDRAYLAYQMVEHQKTAQLLAWEIGQGEDADLQRFASENLPIVLEHLRVARDLAAQIPLDVSQSSQKR
jgi:putative membrane protein